MTEKGNFFYSISFLKKKDDDLKNGALVVQERKIEVSLNSNLFSNLIV